MLVIGLTGGIATGKSTVSRMLREMGAWVIDADVAAHRAVAPGQPALQAIAEAFGAEMIREDGTLDRGRLAQRVFRDEEALQRLNAIVHPQVRRLMFAELEEARRASERAVVLDVPLLIEGGLYKQVDQVWLVYVDEQEQLRRLMAREGYGKEEAKRRLRAQWPIEQKRAYADVIIDNRGDEQRTRQHVAELWRRIKEQGLS